MSYRQLTIRLLRALRLNKFVARAYYKHLHGFSSATNELPTALERCFRAAVDLGIAEQGDYYEFGIFKGYTFWRAQQLANRFGLSRMEFFGFDSFAGLPAPRGVDETDEEFFYEAQYACSKQQVIDHLTSAGVDWSRTHLIEGFFEETLTESTKRELGMRQAAIVLIDCDLYASAKLALDFAKDLMGHKTIVVFDDWNAFDKDNNRGERKAFGEFLDENAGFSKRELFDYGTYGKVFVVDRASADVCAQGAA